MGISAGSLIWLGTGAASAGAFALGVAAARADRRRRLLWTGVALALILAKAVLHAKPAWEAALFPWCGYVYLQSYWLYPLGLFFAGLALPQLPVRWNRWVLGAAAAGFLAYSLWAEAWMVLPPDDSSTQIAGPDHLCRQTTPYTCVPASCVTLLSLCDVAATEGEMVRLCRTRKNGTSTFNAYRGLKLKLRGSPFEVRIFDFTEAEFLALRQPVLFCDSSGHAIVMQYDGAEVLLFDPYTPAPLHLRPDLIPYDLHGVGAVVRPANAQAAR